MTPEQKRDYWTAHIEGWQQSDLTQPAYCSQHNISYVQFGYWRTRLNRKTKSEGKLIPATIIKSEAIVSLYLPAGVRLDVPDYLLVDVLPVIYRTLQAQAQ